MFDLIFISMENWDAIWRRNQFLCAELGTRFPEMKILFVALPTDVSNCVRTGRIGEMFRRSTYKVEGFENITCTHPLKLFPNSIALGRRLNEAMFRRHVRRAAGRMGMGRPLLWINPYWAGHMAGQMDERAVVYDITDDWELSTTTSADRELIRQQDRRLCAAADLVVVCSEALRESREAVAKRMLLLPNGVHAEHYSSINGTASHDLARPVFGYTGTLHPDRIDPLLIEALARSFPNGRVELIGPNHLPRQVVSRLAAMGNVNFAGPVGYDRIPQEMSRFDVCVVPHVETPFTQSLNPIKLWEYLASGKPVVSSNVAGFSSYGHLCHIASGADAFVAACKAALGENGSRCDARREEARRHSWAARVDRLLEALKTLGDEA
jgi:glycosyltransferase involved in cell wall biosynthesis